MALPLQSPQANTVPPADLTMSVAETIAALKEARDLPIEALRHAVAYAPEIAPTVIALMRKTGAGALLLPWEANLLFWGIHAVAAARRTELCGPLLQLLQQLGSDERVEEELGANESLAKVVISAFDGDPDPLIEICARRDAGEFVRWQLMRALARLTFDGAVPVATTFAFLDRFERETLAEPGDAAWEGWQEAIWLLGAAAFFPRIRATWEDGRNPNPAFPMWDWEEVLAAPDAEIASLARFEDAAGVPLRDLTEDLAWTAPRPSSARARDNRQATDPADITALKRNEIAWIARFLETDKVPVGCMSFEHVDGFFSGLLAGPVGAQLDEHLPTIWTSADGEQAGPTYDSPEQASYVDALLRRHWNTIHLRLDGGYPHRPTLIAAGERERARYWAGGFFRAVASQSKEWQSRASEPSIGELSNLILTLGADPEKLPKHDRITAQLRDQLVETLPKRLVTVHHAWRGLANPFPEPPSFGRKVGRNERCPCGSGKKFKHCCGTPEKLVAH
jgi:uncharacterized protein